MPVISDLPEALDMALIVIPLIVAMVLIPVLIIVLVKGSPDVKPGEDAG